MISKKPYGRPTQKTEDLYIASVDRTLQDYAQLLRDAGAGKLRLANTDFDTGHDTKAGEYRLTDNTYAKLLGQLEGRNFDQIAPALRENILSFYSNPDSTIATEQKPSAWKKTQQELEQLRAASTPPSKSTQ